MRRPIAIATLLLAAASCGSISATSDGGSGGVSGAGGAVGTGGGPGSGGTATGGATGSGGNHGGGGQAGGPSCDQIQAEYEVALVKARECSVGGSTQCQQTAASALGCNGCATFVNDGSGLSKFSDEWNQAGCNQNQVCTNIACLAPKSATCKASDAGGGGAICVDARASSAGP